MLTSCDECKPIMDLKNTDWTGYFLLDSSWVLADQEAYI